jgi:AraC-like DNA-binding protein
MARHAVGHGSFGRVPSAGGGIARLACERARHAGIRIGPLLAQAGLTAAEIEDHQARFATRSQIRLLELVAQALQDDLLGFHLASEFDLREIGLLYYAMASSDALGDAIRRGARYSSITNEGIVVDLQVGRDVSVTFRYLGVERRHERHQIEFWLTAFVRVCRQLSGRRLVPDRVRFVHPRSANGRALQSFFGHDVEFGSDVDEIAFPAEVLRIDNLAADPFLNRILIKSCEDALATRGRRPGPLRPDSLRPDLENAIVPMLPHGHASAGEVSRGLGMSQRTLTRRLSAEGLTFSGVLNALRRDLAGHYLRDASLSISQVAWLLGFGNLSAFTHAFKRWTGTTPRAARASKRREGSVTPRRKAATAKR